MTKAYTPSNLLWKDFNATVTTLLGLEGQRTGSGVEDQRNLLIRQGVMELQSVIEQYRVNHETVYQPQDFVTEGHASRGVKPPQSIIKSVFLCRSCSDQCTGTAKCDRFPTEPWPWSDRFALVNGNIPVNNGTGKFCVDPQGYTFYVYPEVFDCWLLSIHWDGLKLDFGDLDETPFDEMTAGAVADFVKANLKPEVQDSQGLVMYDRLLKEFRGTKIPLLAHRERLKTQG